MVCLNSTAKSLTIELTNSTALPLDWTSHFATRTATTFVESATDGTITDTTPVTIVTAPTGTNVISIREVTVYNPNSVAVTFVVKLVNGGSSRVIYRQQLEGQSVWSSLANSNTDLFTSEEKTKLAGIATGAEVNVNADWNAASGDAQILNKPTLGTAAAQDVEAFATALQGSKADTAVQPSQLIDVLTIPLSDNTSTVSIGTAVEYLTLRYDLTVQSIWFETPHQAPTGSDAIVRVLYNGANIFTDPDALTITDGQTSVGPLTPNTTALVSGGVLRFDIQQVGSTDSGKGYRVTIKGVRS